MIRSATRVLAATLVLAFAAPLSAAEIRLPRHPDYSEGRIVFSYLGDLWLVNDDGSTPRRLTVHAARDSHPKFSPDGKWIAFSSNRYGADDVFVMPAAGGAAQRISFGDGAYSTPVWSPRGNYIAFTKQTANTFAIGVMKPDGSGERILTEGFHNEGPTFAPNGRVIMYFSDNVGSPGPSLFTIDTAGRNQQRVPTPSYASDPAWSPLLS